MIKDRGEQVRNSDRIISLVLTVFSVLGYSVSLTFKGTAGLLPQLVFACLFIASAALMIQSGRKTSSPLPTEWKRWFLSAGLIVLYVIGVSVAGFYLATFVFIAVTMYLFGVRQAALLIGVPLGFNLLVYVIFAHFLGIIVPAPLFL